MKPITSSPAFLTRETWLQAAVDKLRPLFAEKGHTVPPVQVSIGFTSGGLRSSHIGQCWATTEAEDQVNHIFIIPALGKPVAQFAQQNRQNSVDAAVLLTPQIR